MFWFEVLKLQIMTWSFDLKFSCKISKNKITVKFIVSVSISLLKALVLHLTCYYRYSRHVLLLDVGQHSFCRENFGSCIWLYSTPYVFDYLPGSYTIRHKYCTLVKEVLVLLVRTCAVKIFHVDLPGGEWKKNDPVYLYFVPVIPGSAACTITCTSRASGFANISQYS